MKRLWWAIPVVLVGALSLGLWLRRESPPVAQPVAESPSDESGPAEPLPPAAALETALKQREPPPQTDVGAWNAHRDALLTEFEKAEKLDPGFIPAMVQCIRDPNADPVGRDYSLQHLGYVYARLAREQADWAQSAEAGEIREVIKGMWAESGGTLAGTALLGWSYLAEEFPEFGKEELREAALRVAREAPEGSASRRTAVSLCGRYRIAEALPLVRECARRESDLPLRTAAVFALGELGNRTDLQWLRQTAGQAPVILRAAFRAASVKIERRLSET